MSIGYVCLPRRRLIISVWDGPVSYDDWRANVRNIMSHPDFSAIRIHLTDISHAIADGTIGEEQIREMVAFISSNDPSITGRKIAILGGNEFEKSRLYERLVEPFGINTIVFNDLGRACTWLGIDQEVVQLQIDQLRGVLRGGTYTPPSGEALEQMELE